MLPQILLLDKNNGKVGNLLPLYYELNNNFLVFLIKFIGLDVKKIII